MDPAPSSPALAVALCLGAYLVGGIPFGLLLGLAKGVDIRTVGSGNIGATNLGRALGRPWGITAFLLDFLKGLVPVIVARLLVPAARWPDPGSWLPMLVGLAAVLGHVFPIYLRFRGGKGVATTFGIMAGLAWLPTLIGGAAWLIVFLSTRTVSVASIVAALALPAVVALLARDAADRLDAPLLALSSAIALLVVVRHRANIGRLLRGEELRFGAKR